MQVFVPFPDAYASAACLDKKRQFKQLLEIRYIVNCIRAYQDTGDEKHLKHPVMRMYKDYPDWLEYYAKAITAIRSMTEFDEKEPPRPYFIGYIPLHESHKKRLYQKGMLDQQRFYEKHGTIPLNHYRNFRPFDSDNEENIYIIDKTIYYYLKGKLLRTEPYVSIT